MWLLYLDESGNVGQHSSFVLGGVAVFEGEIYKMTQALNAVVDSTFPNHLPSLELHVREIRTLCLDRNSPYTKDDFFAFMDNMAKVIRNAHSHGVVLFATVVHTPSLGDDRNPYVVAFEDICSRFNAFLVNKHKQGDTQKGLLILDSSCQKDRVRRLAAHSRAHGDRWGHYPGNLPEAPMFIDSRESRLVQLADYVAHAVFRRYEHGESRDFDRILSRFHREGGVIHGIGHVISHEQECMCAPCVSRMHKE